VAKKKSAAKPTRKKRAAKSKKTGEKPSARKRIPKSVASSLTSLASQINKQSQIEYGYKAAGAYYSDITDWISTGCTPLDVLLWGGWPRGRVISIEGDPSQGKSTLLESALAQNHLIGGANILLMSESCLDSQRMQREGVSLDTMLPLEIDTLEQGWFYIRDALVQRNEFDLKWCNEHPLVIGWDTPSNSQEQHIFENPDNMFGMGMTSKARSIRSALRTIVPMAGRLNVTIFLLLQQHQKIGPYAGKDVDCGGGPKFMASLRVRARQVERIVSPTLVDREIGIVSSFKILKSQAGCPPFRETEGVIRAWDGMDNDASMFRFLRSVPCVDPCPSCGGRVAETVSGVRRWKSTNFRTCSQCNATGEVYHLIDGEQKKVYETGLTTSSNATQWRYIFGWPPEEKITTTDANLRQTLDERPGLRTWLAYQCWRCCSKQEPAMVHPVE